jgi:antitoxin CptB
LVKLTSGHADLADCQQRTVASKTPSMTIDVLRKKLLYRALHRGTKELDLLVGGFALARLASLEQEQLDQFEQILEIPETELADWFMGRKMVPKDVDCVLIREMLAFRPIANS